MKTGEFPAIAQLTKLHDGYWDVVRECQRVVDAMTYAGKSVKALLPIKGDYKTLVRGMPRPDVWWRVAKDENGSALPFIELAAWDGEESDGSCSSAIRLPAEWLCMSDEELDEMFRKGMDNEDD